MTVSHLPSQRTLTLVAFLASLTGCLPEGSPPPAAAPPTQVAPAPEPPSPPPADWLLLLHFSGEGSAYADLAEIMAATEALRGQGGERVRVAAQIETTEVTRRVIITREGTLQDGGGSLVHQLEPASRVADFVGWATDKIEARQAALILRDLGGSWRETGPRSPGQLAAALAMTGVSLPLLAFDGSPAATLEAAYALAPVARYLVASQALLGDGGWPYDRLLRSLADAPAPGALDLAMRAVDVTSEFLGEFRPAIASGTAMSVLDLGRVRTLAAATAAVGAWMAQAIEDEGRGPFAKIAAMRGPAQTFHRDRSMADPDYVDLGDLFFRIRAEARSKQFQRLAWVAEEALEAAVPYELHGDALPYARGLSLYLPLTAGAESLESYRLTPFAAAFEWDRVLGVLSEQAALDQRGPYIADPVVRVVDLELEEIPADEDTLFQEIRLRSWVTTVDLDELEFQLFRVSPQTERFEKVVAMPVVPSEEGDVDLAFPLVAYALTDGEHSLAAAIDVEPVAYNAFVEGEAERFLARLPVSVSLPDEGTVEERLLVFAASREDDAAVFELVSSPVIPGEQVRPIVQVATDEGWLREPAGTPEDALVVPDHGLLWITTETVGEGSQIAVGLFGTDHSGNEGVGFVDIVVR